MALIPQHYPNCVVAIGEEGEEEGPSWIASGFLYAQRLEPGDEGQERYRAYLVTNRHVLEDHRRVLLRFNPEGDEPARVYPQDLYNDNGTQVWTPHPDGAIDVAVAAVNFDALKQAALAVDAFASDAHTLTRQEMLENEVVEGDGVFVLGFPMGLVGQSRNTVLVRTGCIARIQDLLAGTEPTFLIDSFVFPGNSGGPVILKPQLGAIEGTFSHDVSYLIGIVSQYVPYQDVAISVQTMQPRVSFEENSGLAQVYPLDYIQDAVRADMDKWDHTIPEYLQD